MKNAIFLMLGIIAQSASAQIDSIPRVDGEYCYTNIINLDTSYKKVQLYKNAKVFFVDTNKTNNKDAIQYDDREDGKLIGKGSFTSNGLWSIETKDYVEKWNVDFLIEILVKDGRYKYKLYNFSVTSIASAGILPEITHLTIDDCINKLQKGPSKKMYRNMYKDMLLNFNKNVALLEDYMKKNNLKDSQIF